MYEEHPVGLVITDDLRRSRLTVFFRLLLAIPHVIWFVLWSLVVLVVAVVGWVVALITGTLPSGLHRFFCSYIRYSTHLFAYFFLVANPYPGFVGEAGTYPVDVELPEAGPQVRWRILLRIVLAIPALFISFFLGQVGFTGGSGPNGKGGGASVQGLIVVAGVLGWFATLATGRMPGGFRDAGGYAVGYRAQVLAYLLLVTERYPNTDPHALLAGVPAPPVHPVHVVGDSDDLRRSRVTVFFRLPLLIPHLVWLWLWGYAVTVAVFLQWFILLIRGRPARAFHRFIARYVRYAFHVYAFGSLAANPFPGFLGEPGVYPLDLVLPEPARQNRWKTLFRFVLAIPAFIIYITLFVLLFAAAFLVWFAALATGRTPEGLRNLTAYALRYSGQLNAYTYLLTDAYPHSSPLEGASVEPVEDGGEAQLEPAGASGLTTPEPADDGGGGATPPESAG